MRFYSHIKGLRGLNLMAFELGVPLTEELEETG
jgi:hypothetical protein